MDFVEELTNMSGYCDAAPGHPLHGPYHDEEYGFPLTDETALFERLSLEIFQAGLSWLLVLRKRDGMRAAFDGFDVDRVAAYGEADVTRLLADPGIVRNRLKVAAIIENAHRIQALRDSDGGFARWIAAHHPLTLPEWVRLFRKTFKFTGGEVVNEFLMSIGYLPGAHREDCPAFMRIAALDPPWRKGRNGDR
jgi:DNA-3-methyladenine glycosylase I